MDCRLVSTAIEHDDSGKPNGDTHPFQFARFNAKQAAEAQGKEGHGCNHYGGDAGRNILMFGNRHHAITDSQQ